MRRRILSSIFVVALLALTGTAVLAAAADESWTVSRNDYGHPDLEGVWANNNAIPMERPAEWEGKDRLTEAELQELVEAAKEASNPGEDALFGDQLVLAAIAKTKAESYDPATGNYNQFWVAERDFSNRTSLVVEPPDGRIPPLTEAARRKMCAQIEYASEHPADSWLDRSLSERCVSFGVPFVGAGYNGYFQIFQSLDHVVIVQEMIHDARIIPLVDRPSLSDDIRLLHGDSRGHWDGDTLVVETRNYSPKSSFRGSSENLQLTERFTRLGPTHLEWELTISDPSTWTAPWSISIPLKGTDEAIFEYACHEGNYGMSGILAGHRAHEAQGKAPQQAPLNLRYQTLGCEETPSAGAD